MVNTSWSTNGKVPGETVLINFVHPLNDAKNGAVALSSEFVPRLIREDNPFDPNKIYFE